MSQKKPDRVEAISNARQIGLALLEFEQSYGVFPNQATITQVEKNNPSDLKLGTTTSNDFFRQLIAAEILPTEVVFHANIPGCRKADNRIDRARAIEKGECGFSYIIGATHDSLPQTPIVVTPLLHGKRLFDVKTAKRRFDGKAIVLRRDNSVLTYPISKDGRVWINGKDIFDPSQPFWNSTAPVIKWPE